VPSSIDLAAAEVELVTVLGRETLLKRRIEAIPQEFDFILLDCPPSLGLLTLNALSVADEVIVPMQPHFFALQGVAKLLETVQLVQQRINPKLTVSGIVLLSNEVVNELNSFIEAAAGRNLPWSNTVIFKSKIRRNIKLAESPSFGKTIIAYEPSSNGAADYRALGREVLAMTDPELAAAKSPSMELTINPDIDPSKLAAANVTLAGEPNEMSVPTQAGVEAVA
jgi:chromosome partitioning protein